MLNAFRGGGVLILCMLWFIHHVWVIGHTEVWVYIMLSRLLKFRTVKKPYLCSDQHQDFSDALRFLRDKKLCRLFSFT